VAICFPPAHGVPFANGPPAWWNTTDGSLPALNDRVDDPRWRGATRINFAGTWPGAGAEATFRGLSSVAGDALFLSWTIKADNSQDAASDRIRLGLQRTGGPAYLFVLEPFALQPGAMNFRPLASQRLFPLGMPDEDAPAWVGAYARVLAGATTWTVQVRVPVRNAAPDIDANGINLGTTFKFFWDARVVLSGGAQYSLMFPSMSDPANPSTWDNATIGGTGCGDVVAIVGSSMRTTNSPPHELKYNPAGANVYPNTLIAEAQNEIGSDIAAGVVRSQWFIANWGSIPNQPTTASSLWEPVPPPASGPGSNPNPISDGAAGQVTQQWVIQDPFLSEFRSGARWKHQCMLCELSGGPHTYSPASAAQNFDQVAASTFRREAMISVRGLADPGTPQRDVYLLVVTTNMPARVAQPKRPDRPPPATRRPEPNVERRREHGDGDGDGNGEVPVDPYATDFSGIDLIRELEPTYMVHVFHDSGDIDPETGNKILVPQTPFGYAVSHEGELHGWEHELDGPDLEQVGPGLYRIRVPTGGEAVITTSITAHERPASWWDRLVRWLLRLLRKLLKKIRALFGG
jgi:hypothetical protein